MKARTRGGAGRGRAGVGQGGRRVVATSSFHTVVSPPPKHKARDEFGAENWRGNTGPDRATDTFLSCRCFVPTCIVREMPNKPTKKEKQNTRTNSNNTDTNNNKRNNQTKTTNTSKNQEHKSKPAKQAEKTDSKHTTQKTTEQ